MNSIRVCLNGEYYTVSGKIFSGGEIHVNLSHIDIPHPTQCFIKCHLQSSDDIMLLFMTVDALRQKYAKLVVDTVCIPYFPYSRQDRVCAPGDAFSLQVFANMLKINGINNVYTYDMHSNSGLQSLYHACINVIVHDTIYVFNGNRVLLDLVKNPNILICAPDKGAYNKTRQLVDYFRKKDQPFVVGEKQRDPTSGALTGFKYQYDQSIVDKDICIVDDICDGGGTFVGLANVLLADGAKSVSLYVTHGIFSRGLDVFDGVISHVYTTDSFRTDIKSTDKVKLTVIHI